MEGKTDSLSGDKLTRKSSKNVRVDNGGSDNIDGGQLQELGPRCISNRRFSLTIICNLQSIQKPRYFKRKEK